MKQLKALSAILVTALLGVPRLVAQPLLPPLAPEGETLDDVEGLLGRISWTSAVLAVSWHPDGDVLATGSADGAVHLWDVTNGEEIARLGRIDPGDPVRCVTWSPTGARLAAASEDALLRIWDPLRPEEPERRLRGLSVAWYSEDLLAAGLRDGTVQLVDLRSKTARNLEAHAERVSALAWKGDRLASGSTDGTVAVWSRDGALVRLFEGHYDLQVNAVAWGDDGKLLASAYSDGMVRVWDVEKGAETARFEVPESEVYAVSWSDDGRTLAAGSSDRSVRLWPVGPDQSSEIQLSRHRGGVKAVAFSPDSTRLASGSADGTARLWAVTSGREIRRFQGHADSVSALAVSLDGRTLVTGGLENPSIVVWRLGPGMDAGARAPTWLSLEGDRNLLSVAVSPDGSQVAAGFNDGTVELWRDDSIDGSKKVHRESVFALAFSPDGERLASVSGDRFIVWDTVGLKALVTDDAGPRGDPSALVWSPDGRTLAAGSRKGQLWIWNQEDPPSVVEGRQEVLSLAFPAADELWVLHRGLKLQKWNPLAPDKQPRRLTSLSGRLSGVALSPDGRFLASVRYGERIVRLAEYGGSGSYEQRYRLVSGEAESGVWIACAQERCWRHDDGTLLLRQGPRGELSPLPPPDSGEVPRIELLEGPPEVLEVEHGKMASFTLRVRNRGETRDFWVGIRTASADPRLILHPPPTVAVLEPGATAELRCGLSIGTPFDGSGSLELELTSARGPLQTLDPITVTPLAQPASLDWNLGAWMGIVAAAALVVLVVLGAWRFVSRRRKELSEDAPLLMDLQGFSDLLQTSDDRDEAYRIVKVRLSRDFFPEMTGALLVLTDEDLVPVCEWGGSQPLREVFNRDDCLALRQGKTAAVDRDASLFCRHVGEASRSYVCVPLWARGRTHGVLHLRTREPGLLKLRPRDLELAEAVAREIARMLARLVELEQTYRDELTGLLDRRRWNEQLQQRARHLIEEGVRFGVMMLDIDHFGAYNKDHGHPAGDEILREIGRLLQAQTRGGDIVCRYGGEEFLVVLPEASLEITRERAEQLRESVKQSRPQTPEGQLLGPVSVSVGVAAYPDHGASWNVVWNAAETALRQAKEEGRDRVATAREAWAAPEP